MSAEDHVCSLLSAVSSPSKCDSNAETKKPSIALVFKQVSRNMQDKNKFKNDQQENSEKSVTSNNVRQTQGEHKGTRSELKSA